LDIRVEELGCKGDSLLRRELGPGRMGGDPRRPGVISSFAGAKPSLINVAVTRAKRRLYVIGRPG